MFMKIIVVYNMEYSPLPCYVAKYDNDLGYGYFGWTSNIAKSI